MAAQKNIRFEIEGRKFEAVGALEEGEPYTTIEVALRRTTSENAIRGEDEAFLRERLSQLPWELDPYWLVTDERHPGTTQYVSCFDRRVHAWRWLGDYFRSNFLVLRRCP